GPSPRRVTRIRRGPSRSTSRRAGCSKTMADRWQCLSYDTSAAGSNPSRFHCDITVDPGERRKGYGSALFELAARAAREHGGNLLIGNIKESMPESVAFATTHGCVERQRSWESRLDVEAFDFAKFARAEPRVAAQRIDITTLPE